VRTPQTRPIRHQAMNLGQRNKPLLQCADVAYC
jgi:hypothetical protein